MGTVTKCGPRVDHDVVGTDSCRFVPWCPDGPRSNGGGFQSLALRFDPVEMVGVGLEFCSDVGKLIGDGIDCALGIRA